jgi:hypothetical protein
MPLTTGESQARSLHETITRPQEVQGRARSQSVHLTLPSEREGGSSQVRRICFIREVIGLSRVKFNLVESRQGMPMLHTTALEHYKKLKRVFARLMGRFSLDDLDDFIQTANSLREWIEQDASSLPEQRDHLKRFAIPQSIDWQICHQIANAQKHPRANSHFRKKQMSAPVPAVMVLEVKPGAGVGFVVPPSRRIIGGGDEIVIGLDGKRESALGFVIRTFKHFHYIFEMAPIPLDQRRIPTSEELFGINE